MILLIDGYNLLRQIYPKEKGLLDRQRKYLVKEIGLYKKKKNKINEIIIVFDAGPFLHATREIKNGVVIVFSGQKKSADDWIISYTFKNFNKEILVVSLDRKLIDSCNKNNTCSLGVFDFYDMVKEELKVKYDYEEVNTLLDKYDDYYEESVGSKNKELLNDLMGLYTRDELISKEKKEEFYKEDKKIKRNKISKKAKKKLRKIKKL
jgi:hypothetical protein